MPQFNPNDYDPNKDGGNFAPPPAGEYAFVVVGAEEKTSQNGNAMLELRMAFDVGREKDLTAYDRLVFVSQAIWKVHQFCQCVGHDFLTGSIGPYDIQGCGGVAKLVLGAANNKGKRYMEVEYFKPKEGYSEQPGQGSMGPRNPALPGPPPATAPPAADPGDYYDGPPPSDADAESGLAGGDNIPF